MESLKNKIVDSRSLETRIHFMSHHRLHLLQAENIHSYYSLRKLVLEKSHGCGEETPRAIGADKD